MRGLGPFVNARLARIIWRDVWLGAIIDETKVFHVWRMRHP